MVSRKNSSTKEGKDKKTKKLLGKESESTRRGESTLREVLTSNRFAPDSAPLTLRYAGPTPKTSKQNRPDITPRS